MSQTHFKGVFILNGCVLIELREIPVHGIDVLRLC
jgi:hypothetical protein